MKFVSLFILSTTLFCSYSSFASQTQNHLVATGKSSFVDVAPIYSCLAYQGCNMTTFRIGEGNRLHIYTDLSTREIEENLARCDLSRVSSASLDLVDQNNHDSPIFIPIGSSYVLSTTPEILSPRSSISISELVERLKKEELLTVGKNDIINTLGISETGYKVTFAKDKAVGGLTDHVAKTVLISTVYDNGSPYPPIRIIDIVRHEFDHVLQVKISDQCGSQKNTFSDHQRRERAAYLDDLVFYQYMRDSKWFDKTMSDFNSYLIQ